MSDQIRKHTDGTWEYLGESVELKELANLGVLSMLVAGDVSADRATSLDLPRHTTGNVWAHSATTVNLPRHATGNVWAPNALRKKTDDE